jgi:hypothetical protein
MLQEAPNRKANQDKLGQLGLMPLLVALSIPGAPSAAVRAQVGAPSMRELVICYKLFWTLLQAERTHSRQHAAILHHTAVSELC